MNATLALAGGTIRAVSMVSPAAGSAISLDLFMRVGRPMALRADDEPTMTRAERSSVWIPGLDEDGVDVTTYSWGRGDRVIVLVHGWQGRASQYATLVRELVADGYRVVAFDAPAHGASAGGGTYLIDWIDILRALQERHGRFHGVVAHSLGALATLVAVADGLDVERLVTIAAPADSDAMLHLFGQSLGFDERMARALRERFIRTFFPGEVDPLDRLSAVARPVPAGSTLLVVHDAGDSRIPVAEALRLAAANPRSESLVTSGLGHNRILTAEVVLDAVLAAMHAPIATTHPADSTTTRA